MHRVSPAFLSLRMFDLVQYKAIHTQPNVGPQPALSRIKTRQQIALEKLQEKALRQVPRFAAFPTLCRSENGSWVSAKQCFTLARKFLVRRANRAQPLLRKSTELTPGPGQLVDYVAD